MALFIQALGHSLNMHIQLSNWTRCPDFGPKHCLVLLFESAKCDGWVMNARASIVI